MGDRMANRDEDGLLLTLPTNRAQRRAAKQSLRRYDRRIAFTMRLLRRLKKEGVIRKIPKVRIVR